MDYADQSPRQLSLSLVEGRLETSALNILDSLGLKTSFGAIKAAIIGESHFCQIYNQRGESVFAEAFACISIPGSRAMALGDNRLIEYEEHRNELAYSIQVQQLAGAQGLEQIYDLLERHDSSDSHTLLFEFPSKASDSFKPLTLVCVTEYASGFAVETAHAYPGDDTIVLTRSNFEFELTKIEKTI